MPLHRTTRRSVATLAALAAASAGLSVAGPAAASTTSVGAPADAPAAVIARSDHGPSGRRTVCAQSVQVRDTPIGSAHGILYQGDHITITDWQYSSTTGRWWGYGATSVGTVSPGWVPEMYLSPNC
jgi:hypothetical protein